MSAAASGRTDIPFEATTSKHDFLPVDLLVSTIISSYLYTRDLPIIIEDQFLCLRLPEHVETLIRGEMREQTVDDGVPTTFWESKVLIRVEFKKDVLLPVVIQLDAMFDEIFGGDGSFNFHLLAVILISKTFGNKSHFILPIRVEVVVLV